MFIIINSNWLPYKVRSNEQIKELEICGKELI